MLMKKYITQGGGVENFINQDVPLKCNVQL